jgi:hypothetical protein
VKESTLASFIKTLSNGSCLTKDYVDQTENPLVVIVRDVVTKKEYCKVVGKHWFTSLTVIINHIAFNITNFPEFIISSKPVELIYHQPGFNPSYTHREALLYTNLIYCKSYNKIWGAEDHMSLTSSPDRLFYCYAALSKHNEEGEYPVISTHSSALVRIKEWMFEWTEKTSAFGLEFFSLCPAHGLIGEKSTRLRLGFEHSFASLWWYIGKFKGQLKYPLYYPLPME